MFIIVGKIVNGKPVLDLTSEHYTKVVWYENATTVAVRALNKKYYRNYTMQEWILKGFIFAMYSSNGTFRSFLSGCYGYDTWDEYVKYELSITADTMPVYKNDDRIIKKYIVEVYDPSWDGDSVCGWSYNRACDTRSEALGHVWHLRSIGEPARIKPIINIGTRRTIVTYNPPQYIETYDEDDLPF